MKIVISEKQLDKMKLDEVTSSNYNLAERIYNKIKNTPFHDKEKMILIIAKMIEK